MFTKWPDNKPALPTPAAPTAAATYRVSSPHSEDVDAPSGNLPAPSGDVLVPSDDGTASPGDGVNNSELQPEKRDEATEATPTTNEPENLKHSEGVVKDEAKPTKHQPEEVESTPVGVAKMEATPTPEEPRQAWEDPSVGPEIPPKTAPSPAAAQSVGEPLSVEDIELSGSGGQKSEPHHIPPQVMSLLHHTKTSYTPHWHVIFYLVTQAHSTPEKKSEVEEEEVQPSPASFQTACGSRPGSSRLSQSLRDGEFDTVRHLLRTCSLPNLHPSQ